MSRKATIAPLFTWRSAIAESDLPPTTRLVAFTLSLHMNERGGSAFPGAERLQRESGLSLRAVREHLRKLEADGWLQVIDQYDRHGNTFRGGRGRAVEYVATTPRKVALDATFDGASGNGAPGATFVNGAPGATFEGERVQLTTEKGAADDAKGSSTCTPVHQEYTMSTSTSAPAAPAREVVVAKQDRLALAKAIVGPWWESPDRRPVATPFIAVCERVQEALDGGYPPEAIAAVLPELRAFTRGCFDWALSRHGQRVAPESWSAIERVLQRRQSVGVPA